MRPKFTDLGQLPRVCVAREIADLLGVTLPRFLEVQRNGPSDFPLLPPMGDDTLRFSGRMVEAFLIQSDIWRAYKEALEEHRRRSRRWKRQWYQSGPPWSLPLYAVARPGERPTIRVRELARILRASQKALVSLAASHDWQLPPATRSPFRWTEAQVSRFLASPLDIVLDHENHDSLNVTVRCAVSKLRREVAMHTH